MGGGAGGTQQQAKVGRGVGRRRGTVGTDCVCRQGADFVEHLAVVPVSGRRRQWCRCSLQRGARGWSCSVSQTPAWRSDLLSAERARSAAQVRPATPRAAGRGRARAGQAYRTGPAAMRRHTGCGTWAVVRTGRPVTKTHSCSASHMEDRARTASASRAWLACTRLSNCDKIIP
jgi:hypothetical protein